MIEIFKHFHSYEIARYLKIADLETVLVENATTSWYGKQPKMTWEDSKQILSTSKRAKPGMSSEKKIVHAKSFDSFKNKIGWRDFGFANKVLWAGAIHRGIDLPASL